MTLSSEQLEREAERARAQVADTLDELRNRISPGQVVDEFVDYARERGIGDFTRNLGNDVRANLPFHVTKSQRAHDQRKATGHARRFGEWIQVSGLERCAVALLELLAGATRAGIVSADIRPVDARRGGSGV